MKKFFSKRNILVFVLLLFAIVFFANGYVANKKEAEQKENAKKMREEFKKQQEENKNDEIGDSLLMSIQPDLVKSFGKVPDGFIWETDGTILSLGDKSMTAEEVVYSYFRGLSSLDFGTVERYTRRSSVVTTYSGYFDEKNKNTDYTDQFLRNMYRECLLSLQIQGIENQTVFAENKVVFSVRAKMLDLTNKDFWKNDSVEIYKNLYLYESDESDSAKSDMYLYDYILGYYTSEDATMREVDFDITVQRYPDLDSGWLVSVDSDVDSACKYRDGKLVVSYIKDMYRNEGIDIAKEELGLNVD